MFLPLDQGEVAVSPLRGSCQATSKTTVAHLVDKTAVAEVSLHAGKVASPWRR